MAKRRDSAGQTAFEFGASAGERHDAMRELQKSHAPRSLSDLLITPEDLRPVIEHIRADLEETALIKAAGGGNVVPFPSKNAKTGRRGMQSVQVDDWQVLVNGEYWEKPSALSFDSLRAMVDQTPVLSAIVFTRQRQIARFCRPQESGKGPGFAIRHIEKEHHLTDEETDSVNLLTKFLLNCGWETSPRARKRLKRDNFSNFMAKLIRDTLVMDAAAVETEFKRDRKLGIDGLYAIDGGTIRLCTEEGYKGDDEIFAVQVVQGRIRTAYTYEDLIYEPRNPRSDILTAGYGLGETELLIRVVTGFLNAMTYNIKGFDSNAIPKGLLHLTGNYSNEDLAAFKRYWNSMVKGINNAWTLPVMVSKDQESKASFENFNIEFNEMYFSKWMTFLVSIICAIYGMGPDEINFEAFTSGKSSLSGSDTEQKLADSKEKGLRPLMTYFENLISDFVVSDFSDKYVFRWTGLDEEDPKELFERKKLTMTVNEMRAEDNLQKVTEKWGEAPLNPSLIGAWQQEAMPQPGAEGGPEDFGQPEGGTEAPPEDQYGEPGDEDDDEAPADGDGDFGDAPAGAGADDEIGKPDDELGKSFGLPPIYSLED